MHRRTDTKPINVLIIIAGISLFYGMLAVILLSAVFASVITLVDIPDKICRIFSVLILSSGAFSAGKYGAMSKRKHGLLTGILCGALICIVLFILYMILADKITMKNLCVRMLISMSLGAVGGVTGVNRKITKPPI